MKIVVIHNKQQDVVMNRPFNREESATLTGECQPKLIIRVPVR